jgi:uncharacterized protein (UPF0332 family)
MPIGLFCNWAKIMATWNEIALDSFDAAVTLLPANRLRSCISRAYYAAYSAVAGQMHRLAVIFPHGWNNPGHDQLIRWLIDARKLPPNRRRQLVKALRRLRKARENADYRPGITITKGDAVQLLKEAAMILRLLEVRS